MFLSKSKKIFVLLGMAAMFVLGCCNFYLLYERNNLYSILEKNLSNFNNLQDLESSICLNQNLGTCFKDPELVRKYDLHIIYNFMNQLVEDRVVTFSWCHSISHVIGGNYYATSGQLQKVLGINLREDISDLRCLSGFYHGAMIEAMKKSGIGHLKETQEIFYTYKNPKDFLESEVLHGVGHAFYAYFGDIDKSLNLCQEQSFSNGQRYLCNSGVFMQFFFEANEYELPVGIDYCNRYTGEHKFSCVSGFVPGSITEDNLKKVLLEYCPKLETQDMLIACYERQLRIYQSTKYSARDRYSFILTLYNHKQLVERDTFLALASRNAKANYCAIASMYNYLVCRLKLDKFTTNNYYVFIPFSVSLGDKKGRFF